MARVFDDIARSFANNIALVDEHASRFTYSELVDFGSTILGSFGERRSLIALEGNNTAWFVAAYLAAMRSEHVVLLLPPGEARFDGRICSVFQPDHVIAAHGAGYRVLSQQARVARPLHAELKLLLSTSGSTGSPKLVRLSAENVTSNARSIVQYLELTDREIAITSLPPFYAYGLSVINSHLLVGAQLALTSSSVSSPQFWEFFDSVGATGFAGVPHTFDLLEQTDFLSAVHPSLRYFTQAGGRLAPERVARFAAYSQAHACRFFVMYGQTEATARIAYLPPDAVAEHPDFIGCAIPGGTLRLAKTSEAEPVGELIYSGPNVMMGYSEHPDELGIGSALSELATGDLATQDSTTGYFKIVGRSSRFIKPFGLRISLDDVESRLAAEGIEALATGDDSQLVVGVRGQIAVDFAIRLAATLKLPAASVAVVQLGDVPRLPSGKVDYQSVILAARRSSNAKLHTPLHEEVAGLMGGKRSTSQDSFVSLGGDSLTYIQVMLLLQRRIGALPDAWPTLSFAELARLEPSVDAWLTPLDSEIVVRALGILLVVVHHVTDWAMSGAGYALFLVFGFNYARFQVPKLAAGAVRESVFATLRRVVPIYYVVLSAFFIAQRDIDLRFYLFISEFSRSYLGANGVPRLATFWFVELYIFTLVVVSCLFLMPSIRISVVKYPWRLPSGLLVFLLLCRMGLDVWPAELAPYGKTFFLLGYVFVLGWFAALSRRLELGRRLAMAAAGTALLVVLPVNGVRIGEPVYLAAFLALILVGRVFVPGLLGSLLATLAAASFYIYMTHGFTLALSRAVFGRYLPAGVYLPVIVACVLVGVLTWRVSQALANPRQIVDRFVNRTWLVGPRPE